MEEYLSALSVPVIVALVYWIINLIKYTTNNNEKFKRFIPLTSMGLGIVISIIAYYTVPGVLPTTNVVTGMVMGAASGLTATGTNQIIKQLSKTDGK